MTAAVIEMPAALAAAIDEAVSLTCEVVLVDESVRPVRRQLCGRPASHLLRVRCEHGHSELAPVCDEHVDPRLVFCGPCAFGRRGRRHECPLRVVNAEPL